MSKPHAAHKATKENEPKYEVGAKVKFMELDGEIAEVAAHPAQHFAAGGEQMYSVRVPAAPGQAHKFDTFGCVPESEIN